MKLMHIGLKVFLVLFLFGLFFIPNDVFAADNVSGAWTSYNKSAFHSVLPSGYDSTYNMTFPTQTYQQIPAVNYTDGNYTIFTQMQLQPTYNFTSGTYYTLKFRFDFGSYIYPVWPNSSSQSWFFTGCPGTNCTLSYQWQGDSTHVATSYLDLTINFKATSNSSNVLFTIGNTTDNLGTFYNAYNVQQGIRISSATIESSSSSTGNQDIIDNDNQNTQSIINNQNQNTTNIINNQNENTEKEIESQKVCSNYQTTLNDIYVNHAYLTATGDTVEAPGLAFGITNFIELTSSLNVSNIPNAPVASYCFYKSDKSLISCSTFGDTVEGSSVALPSDTKYFRGTISNVNNKPIYAFSVCKNGNQALNDTLTDDNSSGAIANADGNFSDVDLPNMGLQSLLNTIVSFIGNLFTQTCDPLVLPLPFVNQSVTLPCMSTIYSTHFNTFYVLWQTLLTGFIAYKVIINLFHKIHQLEDPNYDKVEVLDL